MPNPPTLVGVPTAAVAPPTTVIFPRLSEAIDGWIDRGEFPSPKVCALAVMSLLAFGVVLGGVVGATGGLSPVYVLPPAVPIAAPLDPAAEAPVVSPAAAQQIAEAAPEEAAAPPAAAKKPEREIKHVWLIVLSGQGYSESFGRAEPNAYLTRDLVSQGQVIENHSAVAGSELGNGVALVAGQNATPQMLENCPVYSEIDAAAIDPATALPTGDGCAFPPAVRTLPEAIAGTGKLWRAYVEGFGVGNCRKPTLGTVDLDHTTDAADPYATWSNPLIYFRSIADAPDCASNITDLSSLEADLASAPAFSLVVPNRCHSGSDRPCAQGAVAGLASSDEFLRQTVDRIVASPSYADGGLIAITFDNAARAAVPAEPTATTGETGATGATGETGATGQTGVAAALGLLPAAEKLNPPTESKVGLLLISPYIEQGTRNSTDESNHFGLLATIAGFFGAEKLGNAAQATPLSDAVFNKASEPVAEASDR